MMTVDDQVSAFRAILLALFDQTKSDIQRQGHAFPYRVGQGFNVILQAYIATADHLEAILPNIASNRIQGGFEKMVLCLKSVDHGTPLYPILSVDYNFGCSIPEIKLSLGLVLEHEGAVKGCGFRLESPHGKSDVEARHHYYHAQMINGMKGVRFPPPEVSAWIPVSEPSFPLDAENSVDLLFSLIVSLYGRTEALSFLKNISDNTIQVKIRESVKKLKLWQFEQKDLVYYWRVFSTISDHEVYVDTTLKADAFAETILTKYAKHKLEPVTPEKFDKWTGKKERI